jgi:drug/metabolite transporter (DMT)-like permease
MTSPRRHYWIGAGLVLGGAFCFALKGIFIKLAYRYQVDAISLLALRMGFALPVYVLILTRVSRRYPPLQLAVRQWVMLFGVGITGYYFASYFNFLGLLYISAGLERVLLFIYPTFVLLINAIGFGRRVSRTQWLALSLTYAGILLAFLPNLQAGQQQNLWLGAFWVILSGLVFAVYMVGSDRMIALVGSLRFTCYAMIAATVPTLIHCFIVDGRTISRLPMEVYQIGLLLAMVCTVIPSFMVAEGIRRVGSGNTAIMNSVGPVFTIFLATSILGESFDWRQLVGTALVLAGVFLVGWAGKKPTIDDVLI